MQDFDNGCSIISDLDSCLLEEEDEAHVKIHDVIHEMALWIARMNT